MRTRLFYTTIITTIFFTISSCSKSFLDVPVTREVVAEEYVTDLTSAKELLNGIYLIIAKDFYEGKIVAYADVVSDNLKNIGSLMPSQYNWSMLSTEKDSYTDNMNGLWVRGYNVIRSCNFLLEQIDKFRSEDPSSASSIEGQAYALRALVHFNLVNVFAQPYVYTSDASHPGVPYSTSYSATIQFTRQTVGEVYDHIIADLNQAMSLMPTTINNKSIINSNAIKAFLARIYLFKGDFNMANHFSVEVATKIPIMPSADYPAKLFTSADNESIFWFPPATPSTTSFTFYQGAYFAMTNRFSATSDLTDILRERPNDLRKSWVKDTAGIRQVKKFPIGAIAGISNKNFAYNQTVFRASEMYLTAAESFAYLGKEDSARFYLDAIRQRADKTAQKTVATGGALIDSIFKERRKEFCFENLRMYDLLRLKKGVIRNDVTSSAPTVLPFPSNKAIAPIPLTDISAFNMEQNTGY